MQAFTSPNGFTILLESLVEQGRAYAEDTSGETPTTHVRVIEGLSIRDDFDFSTHLTDIEPESLEVAQEVVAHMNNVRYLGRAIDPAIVPYDDWAKPIVYQRALDAQYACNAGAILKTLANDLDEIWDEARRMGHGTEYVAKHPVVKMYLHQAAHLAGVNADLLGDDWHKMNKICEARAKDKGKAKGDAL
jgi:hypothetical protein